MFTLWLIPDIWRAAPWRMKLLIVELLMSGFSLGVVFEFVWVLARP